MQDEFYRIKRLPPYVIAEVNAMRAAARARGEDIIDLGMGNPDLPPPPHVIAKLAEVAAKLKLTSRQVDALESEDMSHLPSLVFVRGMIAEGERNVLAFSGTIKRFRTKS